MKRGYRLILAAREGSGGKAVAGRQWREGSGFWPDVSEVEARSRQAGRNGLVTVARVTVARLRRPGHVGAVTGGPRAAGHERPAATPNNR